MLNKKKKFSYSRSRFLFLSSTWPTEQVQWDHSLTTLLGRGCHNTVFGQGASKRADGEKFEILIYKFSGWVLNREAVNAWALTLLPANQEEAEDALPHRPLNPAVCFVRSHR